MKRDLSWRGRLVNVRIQRIRVEKVGHLIAVLIRVLRVQDRRGTMANNSRPIGNGIPVSIRFQIMEKAMKPGISFMLRKYPGVLDKPLLIKPREFILGLYVTDAGNGFVFPPCW